MLISSAAYATRDCSSFACVFLRSSNGRNFWGEDHTVVDPRGDLVRRSDMLHELSSETTVRGETAEEALAHFQGGAYAEGNPLRYRSDLQRDRHRKDIASSETCSLSCVSSLTRRENLSMATPLSQSTRFAESEAPTGTPHADVTGQAEATHSPDPSHDMLAATVPFRKCLRRG